MRKSKYHISAFPLQAKISLIFILANMLVVIVNIILLTGVNSMAREMDSVYQENFHLNELSSALTDVQESMTDYLNAKTSDSLEEYFRAEQLYSEKLNAMGENVTGNYYDRMERNIKNMSKDYLSITAQAIEAKRGRNVEKYSDRHEEATELYGYIITYIYSLNNEQFIHNSDNYSKLSTAFHTFEFTSTLVLLVAILGNLLFIISLTGTIVEPIKLLAKSADEVAKGNFDIDLLPITSKDEVGVVTNAYNKMIISIRDYIMRTKESMEIERKLKERELLIESNLKDAQLKYLQAQINPHFLFNTLNAGAQLAMMEDADRTYTYIQNMAVFFRYNVRKGNEIVTLREEIDLIDNYIYILNVRFSGEIHYDKEIDEELLQVQMPSMILQPLVENCVNHGIKEMEGNGRITLRVYKEEEHVCVSVKDNGIGMTQEIIDKIMSGSAENYASNGGNGIGMENVRNRLQLFLEKDEVMHIISEKNEGTEIIIYL